MKPGEAAVRRAPTLGKPGLSEGDFQALLQVVKRDYQGDAVKTLKNKAKSQVYRILEHACGAPIIAKRCLRETGLVEHTIYRDVLMRLPVPALTCHGIIPDDDLEFVWLFLEEADGEPFSAANPNHAELAARWLAAIHTSTDHLLNEVDLPSRNADHYLGIVQSAHRTLAAASRNQALGTDMLALLKEIENACAALESGWPRITDILATLPTTLVHGGFAGKNVVVGDRDGSPAILAFDWESGGWGTPAADISKTDLDSYHEASRGSRPGFSRGALDSVAAVGRALWSVSAIPGQEPTLLAPWGGRTIGKMTYYRDELSASLARLEIGDGR